MILLQMLGKLKVNGDGDTPRFLGDGFGDIETSVLNAVCALLGAVIRTPGDCNRESEDFVFSWRKSVLTRPRYAQ